MKLNFDPFQIFQNSRTPAGLYARKKWLDKGREKSWQSDYSKTVSELLKGQAGSVSWDQSLHRTIRRLFSLHLMVRERTETIKNKVPSPLLLYQGKISNSDPILNADFF